MNRWTPKTVLIVGGVVVLGAWYLKGKAGEAMASAGQAINPTNNDNIIYRGANGLWASVTDGKGTIGTDIYDWLHGED
ncbi:hypothetical protein LL254_04035 [Marinobacter nauticus]|uniref:hypothetical protein n=1 Tax=Marinobacter nauticus TaxID=2743 RepID=UPI001D187226|nr:hypothetical protein [Marinobacter nauticus]MCC4269866.1 hypothetical protein [Marinobacter nauticus]